MQLITHEADGDAVRAGYECACGCRPSLTYVRGHTVDTDVCCCGNEFAIGPDAALHVHPRDGFRLETTELVAPWGDPLIAAWMIGPGTHPETTSGADRHDHGQSGSGDDHAGHAGHGGAQAHDHDGGADEPDEDTVTDPVCGMTVVPANASEKGLHSTYKGADYYFCGKGCKLDFDDDPERFLDPAYIPSM